MRRKVMTSKPEAAKLRAPRKSTVPFEKYANFPPAIVDGKFLAEPKAQVYAWRVRTGNKPSWHTCTVVRASPDYVELIDETLGGQWFCFKPTDPAVPDVRMDGPPKVAGKSETAEPVATKEGTGKSA